MSATEVPTIVQLVLTQNQSFLNARKRGSMSAQNCLESSQNFKFLNSKLEKQAQFDKVFFKYYMVL